MAIDPNDVQGVVDNAKDDTLFFGESDTADFSELATDLSQTGVDWTDDASWIYKTSGPGNIQHPLAVEVVADLVTSTSGWLFYHDSTGGTQWGLRVDTSRVEFYQDDVLVNAVDLPGIDGTPDRFAISFSSETNPYATGAADAYRAELRAYNVTDGRYLQVVFTIPARTLGAGSTIFMAQATDGTGTPGVDAYFCRLGQGRFHPSTESKEDMVSRTTAPTLVAQSTIEFPCVDPACDLEDAGQFAGPIYAMAAAAVRNGHLRQVSPLKVVHFFEQPEIRALDWSGIPPQWIIPAPDDALYDIFGSYFYLKLTPAVPQIVNEVKLRLHVQMWRTSGVTNDRLHFRIYSLNKSPGVDGFAVANEETLDYDYGEASISTSHGSGTTGGEWLDLGRAVIKRNASGYTWLALAGYAEDLSGALTNQRFKIRALSIEPERVIYEANVPGGP